jgi:hypothetical protein
VLKELELEGDLDRIKSKVRAVDFENRRATDVRTDDAFGLLDSFSLNIVRLHNQRGGHGGPPLQLFGFKRPQ